MSGRIDWPALVRETTRVRAKTIPGDTHAEGKIIGYCSAPQVLILTDEGTQVWWRADLTEALPTKPEEPTGLGAVVEDDKGERWVRAGSEPTCWLSATGHAFPQKWQHIDIVRVLSEGLAS